MRCGAQSNSTALTSTIWHALKTHLFCVCGLCSTLMSWRNTTEEWRLKDSPKGLKTKIIGWCVNDVYDVFPASLKVNAALLQRQFMNWLKWLTKMVARLKEINQLKPNWTLMAKNQSDSLSTPQTPLWFWKTKTAVFYILCKFRSKLM